MPVEPVEPEPPVYTPPAPLATADNVEVRLGRALTDLERQQYGALLDLATTVIYNAVEKSGVMWTVGVTWAPVDEALRLLSMLCVEVAIRAASNPAALGQETKTLGAYSHTVTYAREIPGSGLLLTNVEELLVRRAVWLQNAGTGYADPGLADYEDLKAEQAPILEWIE